MDQTIAAQSTTPRAARARSSGADTAGERRVLIVGDDAGLQETIVGVLSDAGFDAVEVLSVAEALDELRSATYELALVDLDLGLGIGSGFDMLRVLRAESPLPIVALSGRSKHEADRVVALELGADDFLLKPFGMRELTARIKAILRRASDGGEAPPARLKRGKCRFGGWLLDRHLRKIVDRQGRPLKLTRSEYALLVAFLNAPQCLQSRLDLLKATRLDEDINDRSVDVQVLRLRQKLSSDTAAPPAILTVRGQGYQFALDVEEA